MMVMTDVNIESYPLREMTTIVASVNTLQELGYLTLEAGDGPEMMKLLHSETLIDPRDRRGPAERMNGRQVADAARV
jgi:hypothetical protein